MASSGISHMSREAAQATGGAVATFTTASLIWLFRATCSRSRDATMGTIDPNAWRARGVARDAPSLRRPHAMRRAA